MRTRNDGNVSISIDVRSTAAAANYHLPAAADSMSAADLPRAVSCARATAVSDYSPYNLLATKMQPSTVDRPLKVSLLKEQNN